VRVSADAATLRGLILPRGKRTTWQFQYGTTEAYASSTPLRIRYRARLVSFRVDGLAPGTTYHYRLVATNDAGTTLGRDRTFTTDRAPAPPRAATLSAIRVRPDSAILRGLLLPRGQKATWQFQYGTTVAYTTSTPLRSAHRARLVFAPAKGLTPGTTYHYRLVATNGAGTTLGPDRTFTTKPAPSREPKALTLPAGRVDSDAATLRGVLMPRGQETNWHFEYGTTTAYGATTPAGKASRARLVSFRAGGLAPGTTYHFRMVATNAAGTSTGEDITFTTDPAPTVAPVATTLPAGQVSVDGAILRGLLLPRGEATKWHFEYGTSESYGFATPVREAGRARFVLARANRLMPNTTYHYRLVATNAAGTSVGADVTFTTPAAAT
jgi:phosphodiesterase/alkaline phosphatase D-like protein